jgi:hypothetical protein
MMKARKKFTQPDRTTQLVRMSLGPIIWSAHLAVVYATYTLACLGRPASIVAAVTSTSQWIVYLATIGAMGFLLVFLRKSLNPARRASSHADDGSEFRNTVTAWLTILALIGIAWTAAGTFFVPSCAALR